MDFQSNLQSLLMLRFSCLPAANLLGRLTWEITGFCRYSMTWLLDVGERARSSLTWSVISVSTFEFILYCLAFQTNLLQIYFTFSVSSRQMRLFSSAMVRLFGNSWLISLFQKCFSVRLIYYCNLRHLVFDCSTSAQHYLNFCSYSSQISLSLKLSLCCINLWTSLLNSALSRYSCLFYEISDLICASKSGMEASSRLRVLNCIGFIFLCERCEGMEGDLAEGLSV